MQLHYLSESNSILNHFLGQIRNVAVQNDRMRFRRNIERIGEIMAYELSKSLEYRETEVTTPLGLKKTAILEKDVVLCSILRAGLPLHLGFLNYFDEADNGFISAYRHHENDNETFSIRVEYKAVPDLNDKYVLLLDPMLATGQSVVAVYNKLQTLAVSRETHIAVVIAAPEGVAYLEAQLPDDCHLWIASVDERLNEKNYIVPGLGDAGDLAYGSKL